MKQKEILAKLRAVSSIPFTGLKADHVRGLIKLTKKLKSAQTDYEEGDKKIREDNGLFKEEDYAKLSVEQDVVIGKQIDEFANLEVDIEIKPLFTEMEFVKILQQMNNSNAAFAVQVEDLVKPESNGEIKKEELIEDFN